MKRAKVDLRSVGLRVERWRQERAHARVPVPEELWSAAVEVARSDGVHATAKALRLDYYGLKVRVKEGASVATAPRPVSSATFVEVAIPAIEARDSRSETVVELVGRHGDRMRIVAAVGALDVVGLAQAFWSRAS